MQLPTKRNRQGRSPSEDTVTTSTSRPTTLIGSPTQPTTLIGSPTQPTTLIGPPSQPTTLIGPPTQPSTLIGPPTQPTTLIGPPTQPSTLIGSPNSPITSTDHQDSAFAVGAQVEVRWAGQTKYYPGVVRTRNRDGTYAIWYDDGDAEQRVPPSLIRLSKWLHKAKTPIPRVDEVPSNCPSVKELVQFYYCSWRHSAECQKWRRKRKRARIAKEKNDARASDKCSRCGRPGMLLLCDSPRCRNAFHLHCLTPPLLDIPEGRWRCPSCSEGLVGRSIRKSFGDHGVFRGEIVSHEEGLWHVKYDDGDEEDLDADDLEAVDML